MINYYMIKMRVLHNFHLNAESGETEGTAKKEEGLEKKFVAPKARGHSTIAWPDRRENHIEGSENDKDD